jgi:hypothetical protein
VWWWATAAVGIVLTVISALPLVSSEPVSVAEAATALRDMSPAEFTLTGVEGMTALEVLQQKAVVDIRQVGGAKYVTGINGRQAELARHEQWSFWVDGRLVDQDPSAYICRGDESITWQLKSY